MSNKENVSFSNFASISLASTWDSRCEATIKVTRSSMLLYSNNHQEFDDSKLINGIPAKEWYSMSDYRRTEYMREKRKKEAYKTEMCKVIIPDNLDYCWRHHSLERFIQNTRPNYAVILPLKDTVPMVLVVNMSIIHRFEKLYVLKLTFFPTMMATILIWTNGLRLRARIRFGHRESSITIALLLNHMMVANSRILAFRCLERKTFLNYTTDSNIYVDIGPIC
ncbi:hypothetical protein Ddc_08335 [Ditylenchus destructor]|nr:hypothetical protein Ddc_08335 [Ditylenchus destructor]